jgi:hypothetical protein
MCRFFFGVRRITAALVFVFQSRWFTVFCSLISEQKNKSGDKAPHSKEKP